ncbi:hypothetical protein NFI96_030756, partial [Prochilodus magdalenae]
DADPTVNVAVGGLKPMPVWLRKRKSCVVQPSADGAALTGGLMEDTTARWMSVMVAVGSVSQQYEKVCGSLKKTDFFGLLDTPKRSLAQDTSAKRISESLGAQLNPDLSWSSSFNTPSAMSPTVILTKKEVQPSPVSLLKDKDVIIVRKLFPSLSKGTESISESASAAHPEASHGNAAAHGQRPDESFDSADEIWRQTVPDAIQDGEVRYTVENVLAGAEDVLSIFFSNSGSALRRVKTKERTKKRVNGVSKEVKSTDLTAESTADRPVAAPVDPDTSPSNTCAAPGSKSPPKNKDFSQWSPLSLSDMPDSKVKQDCVSELPDMHSDLRSANSDAEPGQFSSCTVEKQRSCPDSYPETTQLRRPLLSASPSLNLSRKTRKFVYRVQSQCSLSTGGQHGAAPDGSSQSHTDASTGKPYGETPLAEEIESGACTAGSAAHVVQPGETTGKRVNPAPLNVDHGLDMTQLCKAFAEDFTQEANLVGSPNKRTVTDHSRLPTSAHTARTVKVSEAQLKDDAAAVDQQDLDSSQPAFVQATINTANTSRMEDMVPESLTHDSGCPTSLPDFSTSCGAGPPHHGFRTANNKIIFVPPEAVMKAKATLDDVPEACVTVEVGSRRTELATTSLQKVPTASSGQAERYRVEAAALTPSISSSFLLQTNESGFRTASNRSIPVSAVNLEKAKDLFKQLEEETSDLHPSNTGPNVKNCGLPLIDVKTHHTNPNGVEGNCFLTASQKADVTELCSMLEDADSQYEFTQFRQAKSLDGTRLQKEWDPDILSGIDFDDSFNCDVEKQAFRKHRAKTDKPNQHTAVTNSMENGEVPAQSTSKSRSDHIPQETPIANASLMGGSFGSDCQATAKAAKVELGEESGSFCVGFKTAKGKSVHISEKLLSKARSLFADLDDYGSKGDPAVEKTGHRVIEPSPVAHSDELDGHEREVKPEPEFGERKGNTSLLTGNAQICSTTSLEAAQDDDGDQKPEVLQIHTVNFGFSTAGGKQLKVSEKSLLSAKKLLNEVADCEEAGNEREGRLKKSEAANSSMTSVDGANLMTELLTKGKRPCSESGTEMKWNMKRPPQSLPSNGFKMASGKVVSVSASALEKSKAFFKDVDSVVDSLDDTKSKEVDAKLDLDAERNQPGFANGFKMANGQGASFPEKPKAIFKDLDCSDDSEKVRGDASRVMNNCGLKAVVGNMVHSPEIDSLSKKVASLKEEPTDLNKYVREEFAKTSAERSTSGCGFSTASGKMVSVSAEALRRAKSVLDDPSDASPCEKTMEISEVKSIPKAEITVPGKSWGFSTASGRKVEVTDKALEVARNLFTGCEVESLAPDGGLSKSSPAATEPVRGFSTAAGKSVVVSEKSMKEAKALFAGFEDLPVDVPVIESPVTAQNGQDKTPHIGASGSKGGNPMPDTFGAGTIGFSTAGGKGVSVSKSALQVAFAMFRDCDEQPPTYKPQMTKTEPQSSKSREECPAAVREHDQSGEAQGAAPSHDVEDDSSLLNCRSLKLNGCTITQQRYFEQEAMACTKALLEDDLNEHSLLEPSEDAGTTKRQAIPQKRSLEATVGEGKQMSDVDSTGQPPSKRRLISEFDQVSDGIRVCAPLKSCPNGTLRDRRVFSYNLKPNITHPPRNVMDQKITSSDLQAASPGSGGQNRGSNPKAVVFVPPFRKNIKSEIQSACHVPKDVAKVPSVFVPPVKKDTMVSVPVRSSQKSSTGSESPLISSAGNERAGLEVRGVGEDVRREEEGAEDVKLEDRTPETRQEQATETWQESLELARDMQDMRVRKKKRQTIRPLPGSFHLAKTSGVTRTSLREAVGFRFPLQCTQEELYQHGVHASVSQVTAENAESFRFSFDDFFKRKAFVENTGVQLADGGWLIPDNRGTMGKEEFYRALCDTPGVDPKLISEAWVFNHYRWIVWKRACMERAFPAVMGSRCLTPEQVLLQLKLRYDTEVDHSRRSALKRIMERDDTPAKTLVLCVCGVAEPVHSEGRPEKAVATAEAKSPAESPAVVIWLTDGWYSIKALLDPPLSAMLQKGHLRAGVKVMVHGAELVGSQDACPPLEAPDSLMLRISANSTRRARWDSKLGFHKDPRPFRLPLSSLYPNGGVVGCVDMIVLRSYPTQWMEKKSGGVFVFRNDRAEDREARRHSSASQKTMELLFSKIQAQFEKEEEDKKKNRRRKRRRFQRHEIENLQDGEELDEAMESDPTCVEVELSWSDSERQRVIFSDESRFSLGGDAQRIRVWRHRGQHRDERCVITRPEGLVSLHPYRTICRNCVRMFKLHGMDYHRTPSGTSTAPYRDLWDVGLANTAARRHTERQTSAHLSAGQMEALSVYRRSVAERRQAELQERVHRAVQGAEGGCNNRDVTPVWKLAIADYRDPRSNCIYTLNIWRPSVELRSLLREGCRYKAYHLAASETKKRCGTTNIQFTATKKTQFQDVEVCPERLRAHFPVRRLASFRDLQNSGFSSPCGEVDVVGYVVSILDRQAPSPVLYLVDDQFDFVSVRIFSGLVQLALEDLVKPLALLAVSNLQLRELSGPVPRLYAGEQALFSVNPKEAHLQEAVAHLKTFVQGYSNFFSVAEEKFSNLISPGSLKSVQSPRSLGLVSMPKPIGRGNVTPKQSRVFSPFTPVTRSTPASAAQTPEDKDPKSLKRKRGVDYLSRVPSPPPISPLSTVASPSVKKTFNPPRRSGPPQPACRAPAPTRRAAPPAVEEKWVNDEELAMINTQTLLD